MLCKRTNGSAGYCNKCMTLNKQLKLLSYCCSSLGWLTRLITRQRPSTTYQSNTFTCNTSKSADSTKSGLFAVCSKIPTPARGQLLKPYSKTNWDYVPRTISLLERASLWNEKMPINVSIVQMTTLKRCQLLEMLLECLYLSSVWNQKLRLRCTFSLIHDDLAINWSA